MRMRSKYTNSTSGRFVTDNGLSDLSLGHSCTFYLRTFSVYMCCYVELRIGNSDDDEGTIGPTRIYQNLNR